MKIFGVLGMCLALLLVAPACDKDAKTNGRSGAATKAEKKKQAAKLVAPAFFKKIPADTVFVFANYERLDTTFINAIADYIAPVIEMSKAKLRQDSPQAAQFMQENGDLFTLAGIKKIGISTTPFFAIYSQDLSVVMRVELEDGTALLGFIDKLIEKYGEGDASLASKTVGTMRYWESPSDDDELAILIGVDKKELVVAFMPSALRADLKPFVLGEKLPAKNIVDSGTLLNVVAENGGAKGVGYLDARAAMKFLMSGHRGLAGSEMDLSGMSKVCKAEIMDLANLMPRFVFGYERMDTSEMSMYYGVELRDDVAERLSKVVRPVPGYSYAANSNAVVTAGLGINVGSAIAWVNDISRKLKTSPYQCEELQELNQALNEIEKGASVAEPMVGDIEGGLMILENFSIENPLAMTGMVAIQSKDLGALLGVVRNLVPGMSSLKLEPGAEPSKVDLSSMPVPLEVYAARSQTMVGVAVGDARKNLKALIASKADKDGPFFVMSNDYQAMAAVLKDEGDGDPESEMAKEILAKLGNMIFEMRATESGLVMRSAVTWR